MFCYCQESKCHLCPNHPRSQDHLSLHHPRGQSCSLCGHIARPRGPPRPNYSRGNMAKSCKTWRSKSSNRKATVKVTSSLLARPPYMPAWQNSQVCWWLPTRFSWGKPLCPTHSPCCQGPPQWRNSLLQQLPLHLYPSSLPGPKGGILPQILWTASLQVEPCPRQPCKSPPVPKGKRSCP